MASAGITSEDAEAAYREYSDKRSGNERWRERDAEVSATARVHDAVLDGRSGEQIEQQRAEIVKRLDELVRRSGPTPTAVDATETVAEIEAAITRATEALHYREMQSVGLRKDIAQGLPAGTGRGELEERVAQWRQEVAKLEHFGAALKQAIDHLTEATKLARADFVPRLNASVGHTVAAITGGHYDDILLSFSGDNLGISLSGPDTPQRVAVSALSVGTVEQCYIGLRLAIAGLLSEGGERLPLILDDPFVNFDRPRLERMLAFLVELSREHQVLLFSKDDSLPAWFEAHVTEPERLRAFAMGETER